MLYRKNKNGQLIWDANILTFIQCFTWHQQQKQLISLPVPLNRDLRRKSQKYWKRQWLGVLLLGRNLWPSNQSALTFTAQIQHGLVKDMYLSSEQSVKCAGRASFSSLGVYIYNFVTKVGRKDPSFPSLCFEASDLHLGSVLAGSWGRNFVDNMWLASTPVWIKHCSTGRNCLPDSQGHKSRSSGQYTQGTNLSFCAGHHQHWHSAIREREGPWPREDKTCHCADLQDNSGSQEAPLSESSYKKEWWLDVVAESASAQSGLGDLSKHAALEGAEGTSGKVELGDWKTRNTSIVVALPER